MISVRKAGLGATLKNGSKWPFSGNFSDEEGGGGEPATLPLKPPMNFVTNVCAENFPSKEYKNYLSTWLADFDM